MKTLSYQATPNGSNKYFITPLTMQLNTLLQMVLFQSTLKNMTEMQFSLLIMEASLLAEMTFTESENASSEQTKQEIEQPAALDSGFPLSKKSSVYMMGIFPF